jgi:hypothetical protein
MNHLKYIGLLFGILLGNMLPAQTEQEKLQEIVVERSWKRLVQPENADYFRYQGWVLDRNDYAPVERAGVRLMQAGKVIDAALCDAEGRFEMQIPWQVIEKGGLVLMVTYLGKSVAGLQLPMRNDEIVILADTEVYLETVKLHAEREGGVTICDFPGEKGPKVISCGWGASTLFVLAPAFRPDQNLYRPLDEWLMMHNSEIKHTGRW